MNLPTISTLFILKINVFLSGVLTLIRFVTSNESLVPIMLYTGLYKYVLLLLSSLFSIVIMPKVYF